MKKLLVIVLALAMTVGLLAGCGAKTPANPSNPSNPSTPAGPTADSPEKVSLKLWTPEEEMDILKEMCEAFNAAHPEFDCTFDYAVLAIDETVAQLQNDAETAADIFQMPSAGITMLKESGNLLPIAYDIENVKKLYGEGAVMSCSMTDDKLGTQMYAVPFSPNSWFMYYNKELYTEDDVKSLETMMAKDLGPDSYNFACDLDNGWYLSAFFYAGGCTLYGPDGTDPTNCGWNDANGLTVGKYLIDLAANPKYIDAKDGVDSAYFKEGKLGAICTGAWSAPDLIEALGDKLGACALPTIKLNGKDCHLSAFSDYKTWAVKSNTKHPLAAQMLAEWLANEECQLSRYKAAGAIPTCLSLVENPEVASNVAASGALAASEFAVVQPTIPQIDYYWTPAQAFGEEVLRGEVNEGNLQAKLDVLAASVTSSGIGG